MKATTTKINKILDKYNIFEKELEGLDDLLIKELNKRTKLDFMGDFLISDEYDNAGLRYIAPIKVKEDHTVFIKFDFIYSISKLTFNRQHIPENYVQILDDFIKELYENLK